jgi:predicted RNase H-like HicB family nuclease
MAETTRKAGAELAGPDSGDGWVEYHGDAYRLPVYLTASGGGHAAVAATLPGVSGSGTTPDEAVDRARRAAADLIRDRKRTNHPIPWTDPTPAPAGAVTRWVIVRLTDPT